MGVDDQLRDLLPLALRRARHYEAKFHQPYGEFDTAALLGAWKAVTNYDPDKGSSLRTYAWLRIDGEIIDQFRDDVNQRGGSRKSPHLRMDVTCVDFTGPSRDESHNLTQVGYIETTEQGHADERGFTDLENADLVEFLHQHMDAREWDVMYRHEYKEETLVSIGKRYGLSEARMCQILKVALIHARRICLTS